MAPYLTRKVEGLWLCVPSPLRAPRHPDLVSKQSLPQAPEPVGLVSYSLSCCTGSITQKGTLDGPIQRPLSGQQSRACGWRALAALVAT